MANKAISELPQALNVNNQDLFVLEQSGIAKKLTAETFITEQGIIDALAEALDGHGGIQSVTLSSVSGRIRTYLITFTDETTTTFQVYDGTSIDRIVKTSTAGLTDTYTVFMNDGSTTFFTVTNGADGTVSEAMLNDALKDKAPAITETTESSAIANFTDGADDLVMHNIVAEIAPVQSGSGDPSPSNIRPISGWTGVNAYRTGKNLLPKVTGVTNVNGLSSVVNADGSLTVTGTATGTGGYITAFVNLATTIAPQTLITVSTTTNVPGKIRCFWDNATADIQSGSNHTTVAYSSALTKVRLYLSTTANTSYNFTIYPQVELGSTATAYEPYITPATASLSWQDEAETVYGGTIDVATGLLTVGASNKVDLSTLSGYATNLYGFDDVYLNVSNLGPTSILACEMFPVRSSVEQVRDLGGVALVTPGSGGKRIVFRILGKTASETKDIILAQSNNIVFAIAATQTYQLMGQQLKTLLGTNNVWADTGNVSVTYPADTKMYIQNLTQPTEDDMTANQAITSGKFFMVGNNLYLATAAIASGAKIIEGTNATRLSLADALNRL